METKFRVKKEGTFYFPQYHSSWLFGLFKEWNYFHEEDLLINGIYTELIKNKVSFNNKVEALNFIKNESKRKNED